ncbi:MAG: alpha/beta hydrolase [Candidatus Magnetomorum sp.]|nr:alpha/beta hydrolase [Candidatus Magnetomorum sp.]
MLNKHFFIFLLVLFFIFASLGCSTSRYGYIKSIGATNETIDDLIPYYFLKESMVINIDGELVHFCDQGQGPVLLLLHGFTASLHTWNGWVDTLKDKYRLIRMDILGFGLTGPSKTKTYSRDQWVTFIDHFVSRLNIDKFSIVGNSLGGYIAWNYALDFPQKVDKLVLLDPIGYDQETPLLLELACLPVLGEIGKIVMPRVMVKMCLKDVYGNKALVTDELVDHYFGLANRKGARKTYIDIFRMMKQAGENPNVGEKIKYISTPTMLMWGEQDRWVPVELLDRWKSDLPQAVVKKYPGVGHIPMEEKPYLTAMDADRFLSGAYFSERTSSKKAFMTD